MELRPEGLPMKFSAAVLDPENETFNLNRAFITAAAVVVIAAMIVIGLWLSSRIERAVSRNAAAIAALYVDSVVAPQALAFLRPDGDAAEAKLRLDASLTRGLMNRELVAFKIWDLNGVAVYSSEPIRDRTTVDGEALKAARSGEIYTALRSARGVKGVGIVAQHVTLMEVYSPIRAPDTGEVIGVVEFYDDATALRAELDSARMESWLVVGGATLTMLLLLSGVIARGGRVIDSQRDVLKRQIVRLSQLLIQNRDLSERVTQANRRAADLNERNLRRISAEIHDGPLQLLSFASLRVDDQEGPENGATAVTWREAITQAIRELRDISRGLTLPELEGLDTEAVVRRAIRAHDRRTDRTTPLLMPISPHALPHAENICVYRVIQEGLNNAERHAHGAGVGVHLVTEPLAQIIRVVDTGPGFDNAREQTGLGLSGLRERVTGLGGDFEIDSAPGQGTILTVRLPVQAP